jgi:hypothetical protein
MKSRRRGHRPPAIKRNLLEQAAMFIPPMSALHRIADSSRTASDVSKVPTGYIVPTLEMKEAAN